MSQETLYFPHDYDPFGDTQFEALVLKHKAVGYAVYWRLVEMLHANADHLLPFENHIYLSVSSKFAIKPKEVEEIITDCISEFKLFSADGAFFWSDRVFRNIEKRKSIAKQRSLAGRASAEQRKKNKELADELLNQIPTTVNEPLTTVNKERKESKEIISYIEEE